MWEYAVGDVYLLPESLSVRPSPQDDGDFLAYL